MIVCGFDQSSRTGWCLGEPGKKPRWGLHELPDYAGADGRTFNAMYDWLVPFLHDHEVERVFWEGVWIPSKRHMLNVPALFKLISITNAIQSACARLEIVDGYIEPAEWRVTFLGRGQAPKGQGGGNWLKEAAKREALRRGYLCATDHEAEAIGIWDHGCTLVDKNYHWTSQAIARRAALESQEEA